MADHRYAVNLVSLRPREHGKDLRLEEPSRVLGCDECPQQCVAVGHQAHAPGRGLDRLRQVDHRHGNRDFLRVVADGARGFLDRGVPCLEIRRRRRAQAGVVVVQHPDSFQAPERKGKHALQPRVPADAQLGKLVQSGDGPRKRAGQFVCREVQCRELQEVGDLRRQRAGQAVGGQRHFHDMSVFGGYAMPVAQGSLGPPRRPIRPGRAAGVFVEAGESMPFDLCGIAIRPVATRNPPQPLLELVVDLSAQAGRAVRQLLQESQVQHAPRQQAGQVSVPVKLDSGQGLQLAEAAGQPAAQPIALSAQLPKRREVGELLGQWTGKPVFVNPEQLQFRQVSQRHRDFAGELVVVEIQLLEGGQVAQLGWNRTRQVVARNRQELNRAQTRQFRRNRAGQLVAADAQVRQIAQLAKFRRHGTDQPIKRHAEPLQRTQVAQLGRNRAGQLVVAELQGVEARQYTELRWDGTVEAVPRQIEGRQLAQLRQRRWDRTRQLVVVENQRPQLCQIPEFSRNRPRQFVAVQNQPSQVCQVPEFGRERSREIVARKRQLGHEAFQVGQDPVPLVDALGGVPVLRLAPARRAARGVVESDERGPVARIGLLGRRRRGGRRRVVRADDEQGGTKAHQPNA